MAYPSILNKAAWEPLFLKFVMDVKPFLIASLKNTTPLSWLHQTNGNWKWHTNWTRVCIHIIQLSNSYDQLVPDDWVSCMNQPHSHALPAQELLWHNDSWNNCFNTLYYNEDISPAAVKKNDGIAAAKELYIHYIFKRFRYWSTVKLIIVRWCLKRILSLNNNNSKYRGVYVSSVETVILLEDALLSHSLMACPVMHQLPPSSVQVVQSCAQKKS